METYPNFEARFPEAKLELLPSHCRDGILMFVENGLEPGGFLKAVLKGDWSGAMGRADDINRSCLQDYREFLHWYVPGGCHGSPEAYERWVAKGGMAGNTAPDEDPNLPKIYAFINSGAGTDWVVTCAIAEDGTSLAGHVSSSNSWAKHDIGCTSERKHDDYKYHYPDGFQVIWVEDATPGKCPELDAAYALNQKLHAASEAAE